MPNVFPFSNFRVIGWYFSFLFKFKKQQLQFANSGEPDHTPHFAASGLVLHCLPMPNKKEARLIGVKEGFCVSYVLAQITIQIKQQYTGYPFFTDRIFHLAGYNDNTCILGWGARQNFLYKTCFFF